MILPKKRQPQRSGIERAPKREWPRHRKWLRSHECVCTLWNKLANCEGRIEVSHIRTAANSGTGLKPHDSSAVPMCHLHHFVYHNAGHAEFEKVYGLDLANLAAEFTQRSPDQAMKASLRESA